MPRLERFQLPLIMASGTLPVAALAGFGAGAPWLMLWAAAFMLGAVVCLLLRGKWRLTAALGFAVAFVAAGIAVYGQAPHAVVIVIPAVYGVLLLVMLPFAAQRAFQEVPVAWIFAGVAIHALGQFFLNVQERIGQLDAFAGAQGWLLGDFIVFLLLSLLSLNRMSLRSAMPDEEAVPLTIRRRNKLLVWALAGVTIGLALIPALGRALSWLWDQISQRVKWLVAQLFAWLAERMPGMTGGVQDGSMDMGALPPAEQPSQWMLWLEKIVMALTVVVVAVLAVIAARFLWKKLCILARFLWQQMQRYAASTAEDYVDECLDTRQQGETRFSLTQLALRRMPGEKELRSLPPREQIRRRYGVARRKHPEWQGSQTARETLPAATAAIYEQARYSSHEMNVKQAEEFARGLE